MDKFDLKTVRYIGIIIFICIVFACLVMNAYKYIPEEASKARIKSEQNNLEYQFSEEDAEDEAYIEEDLDAASEEEFIEEDSEEEVLIDEPFTVIEGDPIEE